MQIVTVLQGQAVGSAAHLVALRREAIGKYNVKDGWTVDQLQASVTQLKQQKAAQNKDAVSASQETHSNNAPSASGDEVVPGSS